MIDSRFDAWSLNTLKINSSYIYIHSHAQKSPLHLSQFYGEILVFTGDDLVERFPRCRGDPEDVQRGELPGFHQRRLRCRGSPFLRVHLEPWASNHMEPLKNGNQTWFNHKKLGVGPSTTEILSSKQGNEMGIWPRNNAIIFDLPAGGMHWNIMLNAVWRTVNPQSGWCIIRNNKWTDGSRSVSSLWDCSCAAISIYHISSWRVKWYGIFHYAWEHGHDGLMFLG